MLSFLLFFASICIGGNHYATFMLSVFPLSRCGRFPTYVSCLLSRNCSSLQPVHDPAQARLMDELCILVDNTDRVVGKASKRDCHRRTAQHQRGLLHRAFSVFLFDSHERLLLQKRSNFKVTFPNHLTNTCCSHPLYVEDELVEQPTAVGVRRAAQRRLKFELGIPPEQIPLESFCYLTRIHYSAASCNEWAEHEIDYILFLQGNVDLQLNDNEVSSVDYVSQEDFREYIQEAKKSGTAITPWFEHIYQNHLWLWWKNLNSIAKFVDHEVICNVSHNTVTR